MRTSKQIAAGHRRTLKAMQKRINEMASEWGEQDQFCMSRLERLAAHIGEESDEILDPSGLDEAPDQ